MHKRAKGNKGEDIACTFIQDKGFELITRNYLKKWGEIDIVAKKNSCLHFFEVKSVTVAAESIESFHRPEDNVHGLKIKRLRRIIETYLEEKGGGLDREFQVHILCVYMDISTHRARVKWLKNIIL